MLLLKLKKHDTTSIFGRSDVVEMYSRFVVESMVNMYGRIVSIMNGPLDFWIYEHIMNCRFHAVLLVPGLGYRRLLTKSLFRLRTEIHQNLHITGYMWKNPSMTREFPSQKTINARRVSRHDVIIKWSSPKSYSTSINIGLPWTFYLVVVVFFIYLTSPVPHTEIRKPPQIANPNSIADAGQQKLHWFIPFVPLRGLLHSFFVLFACVCCHDNLRV